MGRHDVVRVRAEVNDREGMGRRSEGEPEWGNTVAVSVNNTRAEQSTQSEVDLVFPFSPRPDGTPAGFQLRSSRCCLCLGWDSLAVGEGIKI